MRPLLALPLAVAMLVGSAVPTIAVKPARNCPNDSSGWVKVDPAGWWAETVEGFGLAGITVYVGGDPANGFTAAFDAFAVDVGFVDGQAFFEFIVGEQWDGIDVNQDGFACMKPTPINPANPGYFFNSIDNVAR